MISRWQWIFLQFGRKLWVRASLFSLVAIVTALGGVVLDPYIPGSLPAKIGADAVDKILTILASSMLAVTTFSLTTMVSAYSAATNSVSPRATKLLMDDATSKNVLGTFVGSFLFSLVGIITLSTGAYGNQGRVVLFAVTLIVIAVIVGTLLRWIDHLSRLGRVGETTALVEEATMQALRVLAKNPYLGGRPLLDPDTQVPAEAQPVYSATIGYVQHIDIQALSDCAEKSGGRVFILALPGAFTDPNRPIACVTGIDGEAARDEVCNAFSIGNERSFDQDPRFGLGVLAEIATRALSPGVNDPGTAIDVIGRGVRVLVAFTQCEGADRDAPVACPNVWAPPVTIDQMFDDIFLSLVRDGSSMIEVQSRLLKAMLTLSNIEARGFRENAQRHARLALAHAEAGALLDYEKADLRRIAAWLEAAPAKTA